MTPDTDPTSHDDIHAALNQAQQLSSPQTSADGSEPALGEALTESVSGSACPLRGLRYSLYKCGMMAEKYPWQTTAAMIATIGCGWVCSYFGLTVFAGLVLFAATADE